MFLIVTYIMTKVWTDRYIIYQHWNDNDKLIWKFLTIPWVWTNKKERDISLVKLWMDLSKTPFYIQNTMTINIEWEMYIICTSNLSLIPTLSWKHWFRMIHQFQQVFSFPKQFCKWTTSKVRCRENCIGETTRSGSSRCSGFLSKVKDHYNLYPIIEFLCMCML